jgi:3-oxoacyl-[acyl-carrier protein] reductase
MYSFQDKVVLVTGGTRGIGRGCAELFAKGGAKVAICGRDADKAALAASEIDGEVKGYGCDVSDGGAVASMVKQIEEDFGVIQILVNNAGITKDGLLMRMKDAAWHDVLSTNLDSAFFTCRAAAKSMLKARYGRIINISSIVGEHGQGGQTNYAAAKAGLIGFTKAYAHEVASRNITVNAVAPGYIETDMTSMLDEKSKSAIVGMVPMKRVGTVGEIAHAVAYLASDEASYITGAVLSVNGGMGM